MSVRPFRFSVNFIAPASRGEWVEKARTAESLGYDVLMVPDHLGMPAPFSSLLLMAEVTERPRVGPFVLNTAFYNPTLLAREVAGLDQLSDGRFELGLGTGYVQAEFETAGIPFPSAGERVDHLERTIGELDRILADPEHLPKVVQTPRPPLMIAGQGNRVLRLAGAHADIIAFPGGVPNKPGSAPRLATLAQLKERVDYARNAAGERADGIEYNLMLLNATVTDNPVKALESARAFRPDASDESLVEDTPGLQAGSARAIADRISRIRDETGISSFSVMEDALHDFAKVITLLR